MDGDYETETGERVCEEVLLPNGIADCDVEAEANMMAMHKEDTTLVYYEEQDPEQDPMLDNDADDGEIEMLEELDGEEVIEEEHEEEEETYEEPVTPYVRTAQQVPKKRKDAALLAEAAAAAELEAEEEAGSVEAEDEGDNVVEDIAEQEIADQDTDDKNASIDDEDVDDDEDEYPDSQDGADAGDQPSSSARAKSKRDNTVDEEQCRVCTTKDDLVSIFKFMDQKTVAELLMSICPTVSIALKDFMPQYICNTCLDHVTIAVHLKTQCESTERELRKKLSRHKNKVRRPTGYVIIDAPVEPSEPSDEEELKDDAEFKVSDEATASLDDDSEDSDFSAKKRRVKSGRGRGRRRSNAIGAGTQRPLKHKRVGRPPSKKSNDDQPLYESSGDEAAHSEDVTPPKRKRVDKEGEFACDQCDVVFKRKLSLVLHRKAHGIGRSPINCEVCGKQFKIQGAYRTHLERHKTTANDYECSQCQQVFVVKSDLRRHMVDEHNTGVLFQCHSCKRNFVSDARLARHRDGHCRGPDGKGQKKIDYDSVSAGKDLFKSVAPLTTTYWSDSFSD